MDRDTKDTELRDPTAHAFVFQMEVGDPMARDGRYPEDQDREFTMRVDRSELLANMHAWESLRPKAEAMLKRALVVRCLGEECWPFFDFRVEEEKACLKMKMRGHVLGEVRDAVYHYAAGAMLADQEKPHAS